MSKESAILGTGIRFIPQASGPQDISFRDKGRLSFDTTHVNTSRVAEVSGTSGFGVAIEISNKDDNVDTFPTDYNEP
jgi:hypothetical protein